MGGSRTASSTEQIIPWKIGEDGTVGDSGKICRLVPGYDYVCACFQQVIVRLLLAGCITSEG